MQIYFISLFFNPLLFLMLICPTSLAMDYTIDSYGCLTPDSIAMKNCSSNNQHSVLCMITLKIYSQTKKAIERLDPLRQIFFDNCTFKNLSRNDFNDIIQLNLFFWGNCSSYQSNSSCSFQNEKNVILSGISLRQFQSFTIINVCESDDKSCESTMTSTCCACNALHLNLQQNQLREICAHSFHGFSNLEILDLSSNQITSIDKYAFVMLTRLQRLDLSNNQLLDIPHDFLGPLRNLVILKLNSNQFKDIFNALQPMDKQEFYIFPCAKIIKSENATAIYSYFERISFSDDDKNDSSGLVELNLANNSLKNIPANLYYFKNLQKLDLAFNLIDEIDVDSFQNMMQLEELNLFDNFILRIPDDIFRSNCKLKRLDLSSNPIYNFPKFNSTSLESLSFHYTAMNEITLISKANLNQLLNLKILKVSQNALTNISIMPVTNASLQFFNECLIENLDLSLNELHSFCFDDFSVHLIELNISHNKIKNVGCKSDVIILFMALERIILTNNSLVNMNNVTLPPKLKSLDLSRNQITSFSFFKKSPNGSYMFPLELQWVNLSNNKIQILCPLLFFLMANNYVMNFNLEHNPLLCACEVNLILKNYTEFLSINEKTQSNQQCEAAFQNSSKTTAILFNREQHSEKLLLCDTSVAHFECQCNTHFLYSSLCNLPCPDSCKCYINNNFTIYLLNCSALSLHNLPVFNISFKLYIIFDFSWNYMNFLNTSLYTAYPQFVEVYMRHCNMRKIKNNAFWQLFGLKILNLENNLLEELPSDIFTGLSQLRELHLANNHLKHLPENIFKSVTSLHVLQLHSNHLKMFSSPQFLEMTSLSSLTLGNNPWDCDCTHVQQFKNWLRFSSHLIKDTINLFCLTEDEPPKRHSLLSFDFPFCYNRFPYEIVISVVAFFVLFILSLILLFAYRQEMQVMIYSRYGYRFFQRKLEAEESKLYDAFLAYCSHDEDFVFTNLIPKLEHIENPYKLCIHQRDFLVGAIITNSILEAVECSKRTIVVLSENFVHSGWCLFEFKSAHSQMLTDHCSRLIVTVVGDIPLRIDPEIKLYLRTNTYIKWGDKLFWQKLYFAMPNKSVSETSL